MAGRVAIVTGAARGIGYAIARRFYEDGYRVVVADRDEHAADEAVEGIAGAAGGNGKIVAVTCDVSDKLSVHNLIAETLSSFGQVDVLVNNAGIALKGGSLDVSESDFDRVLAVNLRGAFLVSKAVAMHMAERIENTDDRSGLWNPNFSIINMSSVNGQVAIPDYLAYVVSKGGLNQMTKAMALELAPYGVRVNAIAPGSVKTDMLGSVISDVDAMDKIKARTPLGRVANPDEIAGVAAFLASEDSSYVTGEIMTVDGGRMALNYTMPKRDEE